MSPTVLSTVIFPQRDLPQNTAYISIIILVYSSAIKELLHATCAVCTYLEQLLRCSGLGTLHIIGAERLQEDALAKLAPLAALLQELSLHGCSALRNRAGQHLQALTRLTYLDIGGVSP